jgi:hypothetical protein
MATLRAVAPGDRAARLSISEAAEAGSHRQLLAAMRDRVATAVQDPNCPPRDLAALTRRLQEIAREIEAIDARSAEEGSESHVAPDEKWDEEAL